MFVLQVRYIPDNASALEASVNLVVIQMSTVSVAAKVRK